MKIFCTLICLISLYIVCHSAPQFNPITTSNRVNNSPRDQFCEKLQVTGGSSTTEGIYIIRKKGDDFVWKKSGVDRFIFKQKGSEEWKIGKAAHRETSSYFYESRNQNLPRDPWQEETWTSRNNGEVTVTCVEFEAILVNVGRGRGCVGQLSLFQGETLLKQIEFVDVQAYETQKIPENRNRNSLHIDSVTATGDCCFELQANDGSDFYEVHPDEFFPTELSNSFYIYQIDALQNCPEY